MNSNAMNKKRLTQPFAVALALVLGASSSASAVSKQKTTKAKTTKKTAAKTTAPRIAVGQPCSPEGVNSGSLDCIRAKWEQRGTRPNPFKIGMKASFKTAFATPSNPIDYTFNLTGPVSTVGFGEIEIPDPDREDVPNGATSAYRLPFAISNSTIKNGDFVADGARLELVSQNGKTFPLYAGFECQVFTKSLNVRDNITNDFSDRSVIPGSSEGALCFVIPADNVNAGLKLHIFSDYDSFDFWFDTTK